MATIKSLVQEARSINEDDLFSFENDQVRVAISANGGVYVRELNPGHGVESCSVNNEKTRARLVSAWEKIKSPQATRKDFVSAGEKVRGVKFSYRAY